MLYETSFHRLPALEDQTLLDFVSEPKPLESAVLSSLKAIELMLNCEIQHRRAERETVLLGSKGSSCKTSFSAIKVLSDTYNAQSLRVLDEAIKQFSKMLDSKSLTKPDRETQRRYELADAYDAYMKVRLLETNLSGHEACELHEASVRALSAYKSEGKHGVLSYTLESLRKLRDVRTDEKRRREYGSPIMIFKVLIGASVSGFLLYAALAKTKGGEYRYSWHERAAEGSLHTCEVTFHVLMHGC